VTRPQFEAWNQVWPIHFHEAAAKHSLQVWLERPPECELPAMRAHMRHVIAMAKEDRENGGKGIAALIVRRQTHERPGGAEGFEASTLGAVGGAEAGVVLAACVDATMARASTAAGASAIAPHAHPLDHAVMCCIEEVAASERRQRPCTTDAAASAKRADGARPRLAEEDNPRGQAEIESPATHHLCTDCDVYLTHEPCAMCAMAMVHSRVRRVLYALPAADGGALGSRYAVHSERSLNHHYQVVRGMLLTEAEAAHLQIDPFGG
jgi:tRNA-specific adenosine deaminase 3